MNEKQTERELINAKWRYDHNINNRKYLHRRDIKFFEGSLGHFNARHLIYDGARKRSKKEMQKK